MRFDLYKPCSNCPFLKKGGIGLSADRVREIAGAMLDSQGATFACHKTVEYDDEGEDMRDTKGQRHCAGALMFAEKRGNATQMMRIMERLRAYDARKLMSDKKVVALVFDDLAQMLACHERSKGVTCGVVHRPTSKAGRTRRDR